MPMARRPIPASTRLLQEVDLLRSELTDLENRIAKLARDRIF